MQTAIRRNAIALLTATLFATAVPAAETEKERHERVERLIEQLVSPNEAPSVWDTRFPEGYDRKAQAIVLEAWKALLKEGVTAFPELFSHLDDKQYCCSVSGGAADKNLSVGHVCEEIMECQILAYRDKIVYLGRWKPKGIEGGLSKWYPTRNGKTLRELQIEATENAIRQLTKPRSNSFEEDQRVKNIEALSDFLAEIKTRREAVLIDEVSRKMLGLPGDSRQPRFGK